MQEFEAARAAGRDVLNRSKVALPNVESELFERAVDCFADRTRRTSYFDLYANEIVLHGYAGVDPGLESGKRYYEVFWNAFPDAVVRTEDVIEQGDKIDSRFEVTGTHLGPIFNIAPTGKSVRFTGMTILSFRAGKCIARWSVTDSISMLVQIGLNPLSR